MPIGAILQAALEPVLRISPSFLMFPSDLPISLLAVGFENVLTFASHFTSPLCPTSFLGVVEYTILGQLLARIRTPQDMVCF